MPCPTWRGTSGRSSKKTIPFRGPAPLDWLFTRLEPTSGWPIEVILKLSEEVDAERLRSVCDSAWAEMVTPSGVRFQYDVRSIDFTEVIEEACSAQLRDLSDGQVEVIQCGNNVLRVRSLHRVSDARGLVLLAAAAVRVAACELVGEQQRSILRPDESLGTIRPRLSARPPLHNQLPESDVHVPGRSYLRAVSSLIPIDALPPRITARMLRSLAEILPGPRLSVLVSCDLRRDRRRGFGNHSLGGVVRISNDATGRDLDDFDALVDKVRSGRAVRRYWRAIRVAVIASRFATGRRLIRFADAIPT